MLELMPKSFIGMNERTTAAGMVTIGMTALGMCQRKIRMTSETISISRTSSCLSVLIERSISSDRS